MAKIYKSTLEGIKRYQQKVYKSVPLRLNANTESDVIGWLDQQENKRQYIISLIREDILKKQGKV